MKSSGVLCYGLVTCFLVLTLACAVSPLGRQQLMLVPDAQVDKMGVDAFQELKSKETVDTHSSNNKYVHCIVDPLTASANRRQNGEHLPGSWEVVVFKSDQVNAFALP